MSNHCVRALWIGFVFVFGCSDDTGSGGSGASSQGGENSGASSAGGADAGGGDTGGTNSGGGGASAGVCVDLCEQAKLCPTGNPNTNCVDECQATALSNEELGCTSEATEVNDCLALQPDICNLSEGVCNDELAFFAACIDAGTGGAGGG